MNESRDEKTTILTDTNKIQEVTKTSLKTFYSTKLKLHEKWMNFLEHMAYQS